MSSKKEAPRRFEFFDGKSAKFWIIELDGDSHTVTYGRTGSDGQSKTKEFADHDAARKSYDKLITQKTGKGYEEVGAPAAQDVSEDSGAEAPFLDAITKDPDSSEPYGVYADWLSERGDPRGEFINLQIGLENEGLSTAQRKTMQKDERKILKKHAAEWLGDLAPYLIDQKGWDVSGYRKTKYEYKFRRGFLSEIFCPEFDLEFGDLLKNSPHAACLRELLIDETTYLEEKVVAGGKTWAADEDYGIATLLGGRFPELRSFRLGFEHFESCHTQGESAIELFRHTPKLEHLHFAARSIDMNSLFKMKLPNLKTLKVHHQHRYPIPVLAKNASMTNLETLCMFPHGLEPDDHDDAAYLTFRDIKAICGSKHLKSLKHLQFMASDIGDKGVAEIISSGFINQLEYLDLTYGCITDEGAQLLAESDGAANLQKLILDNNVLSGDAVKSLKKAGIKVSAKEQFSEIDEDREFLWYGDPE